jgi:hypothetical protein
VTEFISQETRRSAADIVAALNAAPRHAIELDPW